MLNSSTGVVSGVIANSTCSQPEDKSERSLKYLNLVC